MKNKVTFIFLAAFFTQLIIACCDCQEPIKYQYKFEYVTAFNLDNSGSNPFIAESPISKNAYGIRLQLGLRQLVLQDRLSLFNQAYAMCCICGPDTTITPRDTITSLTITTTTKFDNNHAEGSDITGLFKILDRSIYVDVDSIISQPTIYYDRTDTEFLDFYLFTPPKQPGRYRFQVDILLSDKTHISASTKTIELK